MFYPEMYFSNQYLTSVQTVKKRSIVVKFKVIILNVCNLKKKEEEILFHGKFSCSSAIVNMITIVFTAR